jgi:hypothetical protein
VFVDERDHFLGWRSSSAPKKCAAALRIGHLIRPAQLLDLPLEVLHSGPLIGAEPGPSTIVDLRSTDPDAQGLPVDVELPGDRLDRFPLRRVLVLVLEHHPHRALTQLGRVLLPLR